MSKLFRSLADKIHDKFDERVKMIENKKNYSLELFSADVPLKLLNFIELLQV